MRKQTGFTLLEVLVAMAIFALAGAAAIKAASQHLRSIDTLQQRTFANWVADNQLATAQLNQTWPPKNNLKGESEMAGITWYWRQSVQKTADDDLRLVEISVTDNENSQTPLVVLTSFIAKPTGGNR